ncbi:MAG: aminopeptidase P family protein [Thermoflexaceae bacterium]|nr:aminopeptidase P family protein [Thermoflexaceae bacterium]
MTVIEKLEKVREYMKKDNVSVYIVTSSDYHDSEYAGEYFETRKYLSGFTGSAGTLIIGTEKAALYTDGRYFIQAEKELSGSGIELMRMGMESTPSITEYIEGICKKGTFIAADTRTVSAKDGETYEQVQKNAGCVGLLNRDYAGAIWTDRPLMSASPAFELALSYAGESRADKLCRIRQFMKESKADGHILTTLDDIAWTLNIRGNDILYNPMVLSYLYLDDKQGFLFTDAGKFSKELTGQLKEDGIEIKPYDEFEEFIRSIMPKTSVLYDKEKINYSIYTAMGNTITRIEKTNPEIMMKAVKNHIEAENEKKAHIKDGVAVTKFIYWLKKEVKKRKLNEMDAAMYLEKCRKEQEGYIEPSFSTISAYNENAAMMHYNPYVNGPADLKPEGILLVDSGGQYYEGTTDVTRTIALGPVKDEIKTQYTAVLRGMLNLSNARFLKGCIGMNLDILARGPLWEMGLDYRCGTGHGVGYLLGVHEAPNGFRWRKVPEREDGCVLLPGMITTNEPGVYVEGSHGIRIENELLTVLDETNEYGDFLRFETLTCVPVEMDLVDLEQMSPKEINLLKIYQKKVYDTISSYLENDEKEWLLAICCNI